MAVPVAFAVATNAATSDPLGLTSIANSAGGSSCCRGQVPTLRRTSSSYPICWDRSRQRQRQRRCVQRLKRMPLLLMIVDPPSPGADLGFTRLLRKLAMTARIIYYCVAVLALVPRRPRRRRWGQILVVGPRIVRPAARGRGTGRRPRRGGGAVAAAAAAVRRARVSVCRRRACIPPTCSSGSSSTSWRSST